MTPRRRVRVAESFFGQLDDLLPTDRGPNGEPSATDFLVLDLPAIVDQVATAFDQLPEVIEGIPAARMLISTGRLVSRLVVYALEAADGSVDLIGIDLDICRPLSSVVEEGAAFAQALDEISTQRADKGAQRRGNRRGLCHEIVKTATSAGLTLHHRGGDPGRRHRLLPAVPPAECKPGWGGQGGPKAGVAAAQPIGARLRWSWGHRSRLR